MGNRIVCAALALAALAWAGAPQVRAGFILGDAANFVVLYEGNGSNQFSTTNVTINGNIGIGAPAGHTTATFAASGPGTINGDILFARAVLDAINNTTIHGAITGNHANVQTDLAGLNAQSSALGKETGAPLAINTGGAGSSQTINAADGVLDSNGNRVFTVSALQFNNQTSLNINGDAAGDSVVFNIPGNAQFGGAIFLNGLTSDQVLFNVIGGGNLAGGHTLQANSNGAALTGTFLDPNGAISVVHSVVNGRVFGGDASNMQIVSGDTLTAPPIDFAPEPYPLGLLGLGGLCLVGYSWRRRLAAA
jgi:hypothetical protein